MFRVIYNSDSWTNVCSFLLVISFLSFKSFEKNNCPTSEIFSEYLYTLHGYTNWSREAPPPGTPWYITQLFFPLHISILIATWL